MSTLEAHRAEIRAIIDRNSFDVVFPAGDCLQMSRRTSAPETARFMRRRNPGNPLDTRHVHIYLCEDFVFPGRNHPHRAGWGEWSWLRSGDNAYRISKGRAVKDYDRENQHRALRTAIDPDIQAYRAGFTGQMICAHCGSADRVQVDHVDPPFVRLADAWLAKNGYAELVELPGLGDRLGDPVLESRWRAHHAESAKYQPLCISCNARKGAR